MFNFSKMLIKTVDCAGMVQIHLAECVDGQWACTQYANLGYGFTPPLLWKALYRTLPNVRLDTSDTPYCPDHTSWDYEMIARAVALRMLRGPYTSFRVSVINTDAEDIEAIVSGKKPVLLLTDLHGAQDGPLARAEEPEIFKEFKAVEIDGVVHTSIGTRTPEIQQALDDIAGPHTQTVGKILKSISVQHLPRAVLESSENKTRFERILQQVLSNEGLDEAFIADEDNIWKILKGFFDKAVKIFLDEDQQALDQILDQDRTDAKLVNELAVLSSTDLHGNPTKDWYLFCKACGWTGERNTASGSTCGCGAALYRKDVDKPEAAHDYGPTTVTYDVRHCSSCGQDHDRLQFQVVAIPSNAWTHFSRCPVTGQDLHMVWSSVPERILVFHLVDKPGNIIPSESRPPTPEQAAAAKYFADEFGGLLKRRAASEGVMRRIMPPTLVPVDDVMVSENMVPKSGCLSATRDQECACIVFHCRCGHDTKVAIGACFSSLPLCPTCRIPPMAWKGAFVKREFTDQELDTIADALKLQHALHLSANDGNLGELENVLDALSKLVELAESQKEDADACQENSR